MFLVDFEEGRLVPDRELKNEISTRRPYGEWLDKQRLRLTDIPFEKIQVKVVDGEIVFPMEAKGRQARVEGVVEALKLTKEQAIALGQHRAEEHGTEFDPSSVTGPVTYYRIRGLGAEIE